MMKTDEHGNKIELDTVLKGDDVFVWNGDTIGGGKKMKWIMKDDFKLDSMAHFNYEFDEEGDKKVVIRKFEKNGNQILMHPAPPKVPVPPHAPHIMIGREKSKNGIDLNDPGIISFEKKILKNGNEKITIVRKPVNHTEEEKMIIMKKAEDHVFWHGKGPGEKKTIRIIKSDDGNTQIFEDSEIIEMKDEKGDATFITDDGNVIKIRERKAGEEKKIEVEVVKKEKGENK